MSQTRRLFLSGAATAATLGATATARSEEGDLTRKVVEEFGRVPGKKALKFWAPATGGAPDWSAEIDPDAALFCGSSFKAFALAEYLRQVGTTESRLKEGLAEQWDLDQKVFSPSSPVFNPPHLTGKVTARTALEAMIAHSDNTATDMVLRRTGADNVRRFIATIGLRSARIPTSTRRFIAYVSGHPNWQDMDWPTLIDLIARKETPFPLRPIMNDVETMVCSPADFVSFYSRALQGEFFPNRASLHAFRAILSTANAIAMVMPLGVNAFAKGGSIDFGPDHVICLAGGMWVAKRWVYFGLMTNSNDEGIEPRFVEAARNIFRMVAEDLAR